MARVSVARPSLLLIAFALAAALLAVVFAAHDEFSPADAAFPGPNGRIVFMGIADSHVHLFTVDNDGSSLTQITSGTDNDNFWPVWSPDGTRIAFIGYDWAGNRSDIYVSEGTGNGRTNVTGSVFGGQPSFGGVSWSPDGQTLLYDIGYTYPHTIREIGLDGSAGTLNVSGNRPVWSPDGSQIAFDRDDDIYVMNADGTGQTNLTNSAAADSLPDWSPDSSQLVFQRDHDVMKMNADGTGLASVLSTGAVEYEAAWSPDGGRIAYSEGGRIATVNPDGSGRTVLLDSFYGEAPDWQPLKQPNGDTDGDATPNSIDPDDDNDGCPDVQELGSDPTQGGLRNPHDPWDYYDVLGPGQSLVHDGMIDLPNDILGVIQHYAPQGNPPYDVRFDRGPADPVDGWPAAPDGVIDLPNDILGVILQFQNNCL